MIAVNEPLLDGNELRYVTECVQSGWISSEGPFVERFEREFAARVGRRHGVAVCNGSVALDWYGPGVLTDPPAVRVKRLRNERLEITRLAEPVLHVNEYTVDVNYRVFVRELAGGRAEEVSESHRMRYLFAPEIAQLLSATRFELLEQREWLTGDEPTTRSWSAYFTARAT
jgi:hypothetical protein